MKMANHQVQRAAPIEVAQLHQLVRKAIVPDALFLDVLAAFVAAVRFGGLLRLGSMVAPHISGNLDLTEHVNRSSVHLIPG
jgi:hypothetical protein